MGMTLPARFSRGRIDNDAEPRISALAQTDHRDVGWHAELLKGDTKAVGMGRKDEIATILVLMQRCGLKVGGIEPLGVHHRSWHMPEDHEFLWGEAEVVAVGGTSEAENRLHSLLGIEMAHQT